MASITTGLTDCCLPNIYSIKSEGDGILKNKTNFEVCNIYISYRENASEGASSNTTKSSLLMKTPTFSDSALI